MLLLVSKYVCVCVCVSCGNDLSGSASVLSAERVIGGEKQKSAGITLFYNESPNEGAIFNYPTFSSG